MLERDPQPTHDAVPTTEEIVAKTARVVAKNEDDRIDEALNGPYSFVEVDIFRSYVERVRNGEITQIIELERVVEALQSAASDAAKFLEKIPGENAIVTHRSLQIALNISEQVLPIKTDD